MAFLPKKIWSHSTKCSSLKGHRTMSRGMVQLESSDIGAKWTFQVYFSVGCVKLSVWTPWQKFLNLPAVFFGPKLRYSWTIPPFVDQTSGHDKIWRVVASICQHPKYNSTLSFMTTRSDRYVSTKFRWYKSTVVFQNMFSAFVDFVVVYRVRQDKCDCEIANSKMYD